MDKIKVGAVSYLNTKPLLYGIAHSDVRHQIVLTEDYPSNIARLLIDGVIDVGLVPVAIIPLLPQAHIVGHFCIGAEGPVASVCLFSQVPISNITTVVLDYQSRTSVQLVQILLKYYWKKEVRIVPANSNVTTQINGTTAAVVIGDRAFALHKTSSYCYDLAEAWVKFTHLPFVFAAWVANKQLPETFVQSFDAANGLGLQHIAEVTNQYSGIVNYDLNYYYTHNISYTLDKQKLAGLHLFLDYLKKDK